MLSIRKTLLTIVVIIITIHTVRVGKVVVIGRVTRRVMVIIM